MLIYVCVFYNVGLVLFVFDYVLLYLLKSLSFGYVSEFYSSVVSLVLSVRSFVLVSSCSEFVSFCLIEIAFLIGLCVGL